MPPQPTSTTFLIIPLILNSIYAPPQPMANAREPIVYQLSNNQRHDDDHDSNQFSWLPPAGLCSGHFGGIANTTESSVLLLLLVSLPDQQGDLPARHGHVGSNNTNTKVPWTSLPLEPGTYGVPRLGSADRFGQNFSLDVGLYSLSDSSSLFPTPPMTMSEQVGAPALFGWVLCSGDGNGSFIPAFFQDDPHDRRSSNEASTYRRRHRKRVNAAQAQPRKLLSDDTRNFHGHRPALVPNKTPVHTYYTAVAIAICSALLVAMVCTCTLVWCMRIMVQEDDETSIRLLPDDLCPAGAGPTRYSHLELAAATGGFPDEAMIGRGGFGPVYRGYLCDRGCHAAIKVLSSTQAPQGMREFQAEVKVMTRLRHRNIVQLLGWSCWSDDGPGRHLMLVYEFLANGSLDKRLHNPQGLLLAWADRYKIALGVGSAILYLHTECEQCVLHGDVKPANILLDASCNAKLGDFGLARLVDHGADARTTQSVAGTPGYMDPEFLNNGRPSAEADVFSFGVVLLELACGRRPTAAGAAQRPNINMLLIDWVREMYHKNAILGAADQRLDAEFDRQQMRRMLVAGLWCTHHDQSQRPPIAQAMDLLRIQDAELPMLPETRSPTTASVRSLEEIAYGDLDLSAEDSGFEDSSADTAYHTSEVSTLEC